MYAINKEDVDFLYEQLSPTQRIPFTQLVNKLPDYVIIMPCPLKGFYGMNTVTDDIIISDPVTGKYNNVSLAPGIHYIGNDSYLQTAYTYGHSPFFDGKYSNTTSFTPWSSVATAPFTLHSYGTNLGGIYSVYFPNGRNIAIPYGYQMRSTAGAFNTTNAISNFGDTEGPNTLQVMYLPNTVSQVQSMFLSITDSGSDINKSRVHIITHNKELFDNIVNPTLPTYQMFTNPYIQFHKTSETSAVAANAITLSCVKKPNINYQREYKKFGVYMPTISAFASKFRPLLYLMTPAEKLMYGIDPAEKQFLTWGQIKTLIASKPSPRPIYQDINYLCGRLNTAVYHVGEYCTKTFDAGNYNGLNRDYLITIPPMYKPNITSIAGTFGGQNATHIDDTGRYHDDGYRVCYTGSFLNTPNVRSLTRAYENCSGITGEGHPIPRCQLLDYAYTSSGLTGAAQIPPVLSSAVRAYSGTNVTSVNSYDAPNLLNGYAMFTSCYKLYMTHPLIAPNITDMSYMYSGCSNLHGTPKIYPNVTNAHSAFFGCNNLHGTPDFCEGVVNVQRCYANCTNLTGPPKLPPNPCRQFHSIFYSAGTYFNYGLYSNCENLRGKPVTGDFIDNCMAYMYYNCYNLSGPPVCHKNVTDARYVYAGCINMTGSPVVGNNVVTMSGMYMGCENITGRPACPDSVQSAQNAYRECRKLTGAVNLGANLTDMSNMYYGCDNLTGSPKCTENIVDMSYAFGYCRKLTGTPVFNKNVAYCRGAYIGCDNLTGGYVYPNTDHSISDISYLYAVCNKLHGGLENFVDKKFSHADYAFSGDKVDIPSTWTHTLTNASGMFSGARSSSNAPISITISWNMQYLNFADSMLYVDNGIVGGHLYLNSATTYYIDNPSHYFDSHGNRRCLFSSIRPYSNEKVTQPPFYFHIRRGTYFENYFRNYFMSGYELIEDGDGFHWADENLQLFVKYY